VFITCNRKFLVEGLMADEVDTVFITCHRKLLVEGLMADRFV